MRVYPLNTNVVRIQLSNSFYNANEKHVSQPSLRSLAGDSVSFTSKNKDKDKSTAHCAYCGVKIYTEKDLKARAAEIAGYHGNDLQGELRDLRDKYHLKRDSSDLARMWIEANSAEIEFFDQLYNLSCDRANRQFTAEELISKFLSVESTHDEIIGILYKNLRPLLQTEDHISPQHLKEPNFKNDINKVLTCYTCNHDIKNGLSFDEFYKLYPTIKNYMPPDKLDFASMNGLVSFSNQMELSNTVSELIEKSQRCKAQKAESLNRAQALEFELGRCKDSMLNMKLALEREKLEKLDEIDALNNKLDSLRKDPEFVILAEKKILSQLVKSLHEDIIRARKRPGQDAGPSPASIEEKLNFNQSRLDDLCSMQPNLPDLISKRNDLQNELELYIRQETLTARLKVLRAERQSTQDQLDQVIGEINNIKATCETPGISNKEAERIINHYVDLVEQLDYITKNPQNASLLKNIFITAKETLEAQVREAELSPVITKYKSSNKLAELGKRRSDLNAPLPGLNKEIERLETSLAQIDSTPKTVSKEEIPAMIDDLNQTIGILSEKAEGLKIDDKIKQLKVEINLIDKAYKELIQELETFE